MSPKESPDRTNKVKKERAASAPKRNKGTSTVTRLQAESNYEAKPPADKGQLKLKGRVKVKAEQKDPAETDSNLGRLQTSSSSTPKPTAQKAATTFKFTTSNPGRRPCPVCGKILSGKYIPEHLLKTHGTVKSKQFPNCWPD